MLLHVELLFSHRAVEFSYNSLSCFWNFLKLYQYQIQRRYGLAQLQKLQRNEDDVTAQQLCYTVDGNYAFFKFSIIFKCHFLVSSNGNFNPFHGCISQSTHVRRYPCSRGTTSNTFSNCTFNLTSLPPTTTACSVLVPLKLRIKVEALTTLPATSSVLERRYCIRTEYVQTWASAQFQKSFRRTRRWR